MPSEIAKHRINDLHTVKVENTKMGVNRSFKEYDGLRSRSYCLSQLPAALPMVPQEAAAVNRQGQPDMPTCLFNVKLIVTLAKSLE